MNGYFSALMRLGGLTGNRPAAIQSREDLALEESAEYETVASSTDAAAASASRNEPPVSSLRAPVNEPVPEQPSAPRAETNDRGDEAAGPAWISSVLERGGVESAVPEVRAALRWIAAGPGLPDRPAAVRQPTSAAVGTTEPSRRSRTVPDRRDRTDPETESVGAPRRSTGAKPVVVSAAESPATILPRVPSPAVTRAAFRQATPVEEAVEVSIGSIHLRVDAPAVQAVPLPAKSQAPGRHTSSLSRRALPEL